MNFSRYFLIIFLILGAITTYSLRNRLINQEVQEITYINSLYAERLKAQINRSVQSTAMLKQAVEFYEGNIPPEEYPLFAQLVYDEKEHISINFLPHGVLEYSYPMELNAGAIGYDVFAHPATSVDAIKTKEIKTTTLSGPYIQDIPVIGKEGEFIKTPVIVARNPVYLNLQGTEIFWGFISIDIIPTGLLEEIGIEASLDFPYQYNIESIYKSKKVTLSKSSDFNEKFVLSNYNISLGNGEWSFSLYRKKFNKDLLVYTCLVATTFIGIAFALFSLLRFFEIKLNKTHALSLIDPLTQLHNRKSLELYVEQSEKNGKHPFSLLYIDLNDFKPVNDTQGHKAGDKVLQVFASRLDANFSRDSFIARIGGDEFIVIVVGTHTQETCEEMRARILLLAENTFYIEGQPINISASIGYARYPKEGSNFEEVLHKADKSMFEYKEEYKKSR